MTQTEHNFGKQAPGGDRCLRGGILALGLSVMALGANLHAENVGSLVAVNDERNQFSQTTAAEIYNANAYEKMETEIVESILSDVSFSEEARQVKVSVHDGVVTVQGEVRNAAERDQILRYSRESAGMAKVEDQLQIRATE